MQNLGLTLKARGSEGEPLPSAISRLDDLGAKIRRGCITLLVGAPGGGKSALAIWMSRLMCYDELTGVPTLYFSADCDRVTVGKTVVAGAFQVSLDEAEQLIYDEDPEAYARFDEATDHIWWCFEPNPDLWEIQEEIEAYAYVHGRWPDQVIVDNLMDIPGGGSDLKRDTEIMMFLSNIARRYSTAVVVLAHVKGQYGDGRIPIPKTGVLNNIDKKARLMMSLYQVDHGVMGVRVVKNTSGPADSEAGFGIDLGWNPSMGWFSS